MSGPTVESVNLHELACWRVTVAGNELLMCQQGAQILHYRQGQQAPVIWLSDDAQYLSGQGVRGGVPICWPWFGALSANPAPVQAMVENVAEAPFHGLVRNLDWQLQNIEHNAHSVQLNFVYNTQTQPLDGWPHDAELQLSVRVDEQLHIALRTRNLGVTPITISQALHSYFAVSDIRTVSVEGLDGCHYIDTLDAWQTHAQHDALGFTAETDRIYQSTPAELNIVDPQWQRKIHLTSSGSHSAIVWNPWVDKSTRLSQFAAQAWQDMLCIEHANVMGDIKTLGPGEQHQLSLRIDSVPLNSSRGVIR